ncbi:hypothetical protein HDV03_000509 [Kappamyces sp. JEL0829]|nr:hypothetical protein HDV03_000509 [Kappamyces sp. JEL0829]
MATLEVPASDLEEEKETIAPEEHAEKRLDAALGQDVKKKKPVPTKKAPAKGKAKKGAKSSKKEKDADAGVVPAMGDMPETQEDKEDTQAEGKTAEKGADVELLNDDAEADWESDLDVDVIINRKIERDPYLTACRALDVVPVSFISQRLGKSEIVMKHHGLGALGARALGKVLEYNSALQTLDLTGNCIGAGGSYFATSLAQNSYITYLNLSSNSLKSSAKELGQMIAENSTITSLILSKNDLGDTETVLLADGLKQNQFLRVLDLSHNRIGDIGAIALGQAVVVNGGLKELDVSWNEMRTRGLTAFFSGIKENSNIVNLNVSNNGIGEFGAMTVPFFNKTAVVRLSLAYTRLSEASFAAVLKGLEANRTIQDLNLSGNPLTTLSLQNLFKVLPSTKIQTITLKDVRFPKEIAQYIDSLRKDPHSLKVED